MTKETGEAKEIKELKKIVQKLIANHPERTIKIVRKWIKDDVKNVASLMLNVDEKYCAKMFSLMEDNDIKKASKKMDTMAKKNSKIDVKSIFSKFIKLAAKPIIKKSKPEKDKVDNTGKPYVRKEVDDMGNVAYLRQDGQFDIPLDIDEDTLKTLELAAKLKNMELNDFLIEAIKLEVERVEKEHRL